MDGAPVTVGALELGAALGLKENDGAAVGPGADDSLRTRYSPELVTNTLPLASPVSPYGEFSLHEVAGPPSPFAVALFW